MIFAGVSAASDLNGVYAEIAHYAERLFKALFCVKICKNTKFHIVISFMVQNYQKL